MIEVKSELLRSYILEEDNLVETYISIYDFRQYLPNKGDKGYHVCVTTHDGCDLDVTENEGWYDTLEEANVAYLLMKGDYLNDRI